MKQKKRNLKEENRSYVICLLKNFYLTTYFHFFAPIFSNFFYSRLMDHVLRGGNIAILATDDFEEAELIQTKKVLEEAGANTTIIG